MVVKPATYQVVYEGVDISRDISNYVEGIGYTDNAKGKADDIELTLDNTSGVWSNEWWPKHKDQISLYIGDGTDSLYCGDFRVDEINGSGRPSVVKLRASASAVNQAMRTKISRAHEGKTLRQIFQFYCDTHGLILDEGTRTVTKRAEVLQDISVLDSIKGNISRVIGDAETKAQQDALLDAGPRIGNVAQSLQTKGFKNESTQLKEAFLWVSKHISNPGLSYFTSRLTQIQDSLRPHAEQGDKLIIKNDLSSIVVSRTTQANETDLAYLERLAAKYGFAFSIKGKYMIFHTVSSLEGRSFSAEFHESQILRWDLTTKISKTYKSARTTYHDPETQELITAEATYEGSIDEDGQNQKEQTGEDVLELRGRVENKQQAEAQAQAALAQSNTMACSGEIELPFNILCCAGNIIKLTGLGEFSGYYFIDSSRFNLTIGAGLPVTCEVRRVGFVGINEKK